jgi:hypothetical protein
MKKTVFACVCMLALMFLISSKDVVADPLPQGWHNVCEVVTVGQLFNRAMMTLTCEGQTPRRWVVLDSAKAKELLAIGLTAQSSGAKVRAWVMGDSVTVAGVQAQTLYGLLVRDD